MLGAMVRPRLGTAVTIEPTSLPSPSTAFPTARPFTSSFAPRNGRGLRTPRSREYQEWRFNGHPYAEYGVIPTDDGGALVRATMRKGRLEGTIVDVFGEHLRGALRKAARANTARYSATWFSESAPERKAALSAGFVPVPQKTLLLVVNPLTELDFDVAELGSWDFAVSDLELL